MSILSRSVAEFPFLEGRLPRDALLSEVPLSGATGSFLSTGLRDRCPASRPARAPGQEITRVIPQGAFALVSLDRPPGAAAGRFQRAA